MTQPGGNPTDDRVDDYVELLDLEAGELSIFFSDLLIGVTGSFRDREPFEALESVVFPRVLSPAPSGAKEADR
jgi:two-component system CheB/CheR fusion protein